MSIDKSQYILPNNQPVVSLQCKPAFSALTQKEKLYAHYLSKASWYGAFITSIQTSPESPLILILLHNIFLFDANIAKLKEDALNANVTEDEFTAFMVYSAGIYENLSNYKSFGDTKIIPNLPVEKFEAIINASTVYKQQKNKISKVWKEIKEIIYSLEVKYKSLGLGDKGVTTYFSSNCNEEDAKKVTKFMLNKKKESVNTRVFKSVVDGKVMYNIRLASAETDDEPSITLPEEVFEGSTFKITRGDYSPFMKLIVENLEKALPYAANDLERNMLHKYISSFTTGSLDDHKDGSRYWVKNKGPVVETYIGFIETYRDPVGERGEYEGFVAIVDKVMSEKFANLVKNAQKYLKLLPWGENFEKDVFLKPDFTSLDVLAFAGAMPSGINIPNYDTIRQNEGFKNLYLANVISTPLPADSFPFLSEEDMEMIQKHRLSSFEVQVGLHELLGHGSGKLFIKKDDGTYNFDNENVINPLTGKKVDKWYLEGETYDSKFGALGSGYEECRAEAVGLYLSLEKEILKIFGHEGKDADDNIYTNWLLLLWNGCAKALETYDPENKVWLQAHSKARFVLLQVCLEAGEDFVHVTETEKGKNLRLVVNREKIHTVGKKAIGEFLKKLQIYKSTGDIESATKLFDKYSEVTDNGKYPWATWRNIVMAHKKPRKFFVQPNTFINEDDKEVTLTNYEPSFEGMVQSFTERFPDASIIDAIIELYKKDAHYFDLHNSEL